MTDPNALLDQIRIASPCKVSWEAMTGDDRTRFCSLCQKRVYNIAAFSSAEAAELIVRNEGNLCLQLYRRRDGKVLTADCPVGVKLAFWRRLRSAAAAMVLAGGSLFAAGATLRAAGSHASSLPPMPTGTGMTYQDWVDWLLVAIGMRAPRPIVGEIAATTLMGRPVFAAPTVAGAGGQSPAQETGAAAHEGIASQGNGARRPCDVSRLPE